MYKEINNFSALKLDLKKAFNVEQALSYSRKNILRIGLLFRDELLNRLPEGERGPKGQERPSIRLWGQRLKESFGEPAIGSDKKDSSISMTVYLDHPSVDQGLGGDVLSWFQFGTSPHLIPASNTRVVFWWGSPLKWPQYFGRPGVRASTNARQWGSSTVDRGYWARPYGDFEREASDAIKSQEEEAVDKAYSDTVTKPLDKSSYLRRVS